MGLALKNIASLDIGSHTARLLVSQWSEGAPRLSSLLRRRAYIRLAEEFEIPEKKTIKPAAVERTLRVLDDFAASARRLGVAEIVAVATGVVREANNQAAFLKAIRDRTGIEVKTISGEEEACLTGLGVRHALQIHDEPLVIFDLGGGTTEFLIGAKGGAKAFSLPLGAAIYTHRFFRSDPPGISEVSRIEKEISTVLQAFRGLRSVEGCLLVGTGGTVTTLASLIHKVTIDEISPERMNGLTLAMTGLGDLLARMKKMAKRERVDLLGLDPERADVILAGFLIVMMIMRCFQSSELKVSLSDLLEGTLIDFLGGAGETRSMMSPSPYLKDRLSVSLGGVDAKQGV
jgi:exopolyphosphatase/guanosine-5'-triphosphate,3'-diphosphate pyrophosphatase